MNIKMNKELCSSRLNAELITGDHVLNFQRTIKKNGDKVTNKSK